MSTTQSVGHQVLLFAGLREAVRSGEVQVDLPPGATVRDLLDRLGQQYPRATPMLSGCRVAVGQEFVDDEHVLHGGEEIAVIPPVSGGHDGAAVPARVHLSSQPLSLSDVVGAVEHRGAGGIATFTGNVRARSRGHDIEHLHYEAYEPMALKVMRQIVAAIEERIEGSRVAIHHRLGRLSVGETAVVIAASAPHRAEAFEACRAAIEALKTDVPIWKREVSADGAEWIGQGP